MTLRTRVILLALAAVVVIATLGVQIVHFYVQARDRVAEVSQVLSPAGTAASSLTAEVTTMERRLRQYAASANGVYHELFGTSRDRATIQLDTLETLIGALPEYSGPVAEVRTSLDEWLGEVGTPVEQAMAAGDPPGAESILDANSSQATFSRLLTRTTSLATAISRDQDSALDDATDATQRLALMLGAALGGLMLMPLINLLAINGLILRPVTALRAQLRRSATPGNHDSVIVSAGPPELAELGKDAEVLRRELVKEIDQAAAAETALSQESPVVDAIRRELAAQSGEGVPGVTISGILRPAEGVLAGDFWDRMPLGDGRVALVVCDVSGHGPRAGIVAMRLKTSISLGLRAGWDLPQILHRSCDGFVDEPGRFATVVILVADPRARTLEWVNAGHPSPRILRASGEVERLEPTGPMVSWLIGSWQLGTTSLGRHDVCLTFTDGILESRDDDGNELGDDGLDERIASLVALTHDPGEVTARLLGGVRQRTADIGRDDLTLVGLRWSSAEDAHPAGARA